MIKQIRQKKRRRKNVISDAISKLSEKVENYIYFLCTYYIKKWLFERPVSGGNAFIKISLSEALNNNDFRKPRHRIKLNLKTDPGITIGETQFSPIVIVIMYHLVPTPESLLISP
jgi:hypothetical protein